MRLTNGVDWLEIAAAPPPSGFAGSAVDPDVLLNVAFQVTGFGGADQSWVERSDWDAFLTEFAVLEAGRRGEALLTGANAEEFRLRFYVYDAAGHPAVDGRLARRDGRGREQHGAKVSFQMPFEPDQILPALRAFESWARVRG